LVSESAPIFVRGLSRSGGTLMCTLLDAHRDVAMSYELYPTLLLIDPAFDLKALAHTLASADSIKALKKVWPTEKFRTFVVRCERGGLDHRDFAALLLKLLEEGHTCDTLDGRSRLIELCGAEKMKREGKSRWGMKCNGAFDDYLSYWPNACFINMLRDGRDVLASQLNTGSFDKSPDKVAEGWVRAMTKFEKLMARGDVRAQMVRYEDLTSAPEEQLPVICAGLGLEFDEAMLRHNELDLTVFRTNHLSRDRIVREIDTTMIGRWKRDLSAQQLQQFLEVAEPVLRRFGYV